MRLMEKQKRTDSAARDAFMGMGFLSLAETNALIMNMCCWVIIFLTTCNYINIVFIPKFTMIVNMLSIIVNNTM